jgi:hypothetical protein
MKKSDSKNFEEPSLADDLWEQQTMPEITWEESEYLDTPPRAELKVRPITTMRRVS